MGYDGFFHVFEPAGEERQLRLHAEYLTGVEQQLDATVNDPPEWVTDTASRLRRSVAYIDDLASYPERNPDLGTAMSVLRDCALGSRTDERIHLWNGSNTVHEEIPTFLGEYDTRAEELWRTLTGPGAYEVELESGTYAFEGTRAGILTPDECTELRDVLRPILPHTHKLYARLDERSSRFNPAREMCLIETVRALCLTRNGSEYLTYRFS